jgi:hypothetical protein
MPDAEGVNTDASEGSEIGPDENLTEQKSAETTGTASAPTDES